MDEPIKMDIVWMMEADKVIQSQMFLYHSANHSEARLDWYKIPEGSIELYAGEAPSGARFSIYLVDQIKRIEECNEKSLFPSKHFLKMIYLNPMKMPLKICFQQREDLKSWSEAFKKTLELGRKHRKKLEKEHKTIMKRTASCNELDENLYDTSNTKNTVAFEVEVDSTSASVRNGVVGEASIILSGNHITLLCRTKNYFITWQYRQVRRFGYSSSSFLLEGGHKSGPKGEGLFMFSNCQGHRIKECINARLAALDASRPDRQESDDSDCGGYTEENMKKIYSQIKKIHSKLDDGRMELQYSSQQHTYTNYDDEAEHEFKQENHQTKPIMPLKPSAPPITSPKPSAPPITSPKPSAPPITSPEPSAPPVKPPHYNSLRPISNCKMSEVVQALSGKTNPNDDQVTPNEYSALSFGMVESKQSDSDLSSVTGNLYGEALCRQNGFQRGDNHDSDAEYSQINYDKIKSINKSQKGLNS